MLEMCEHPTLRYQWMRYLPKRDAYPWDHFWSRLVDKLGRKLSTVELIVTRSPGPPRRISEVREVGADFLDAEEKPLLSDLPRDHPQYIAQEYHLSDRKILRGYDLRFLLFREFLLMAEYDMKQLVSRVKTTESESWQTCLAKALSIPWVRVSAKNVKDNTDWQHSVNDIKMLDLVPLRNGAWVSLHQRSKRVYFPRTAQRLDIPMGLSFDLAIDAVYVNPERRQLMENLGVQLLDDRDVRARIEVMNSSPSSTPLEISVEHLNFLYLTHNPETRDAVCKNMFLWAKDTTW